MPTTIRVQEAVRLAKEALGDVPPQELANWIATTFGMVGSSRVDLQACKLEYSIVSPK